MARQTSPQPVATDSSPGLAYATPKSPGAIATPASGDLGKSLVNWLFPAYVLMIAAGYGVLISGLATAHGNEIGSDRCLFHSINAASLTGFSATIGPHEFNGLGQTLTLLLMCGGALFSLIVGGLAMVRILRLPFTDRRVIGASAVVLGIAALLGTGGGLIDGRGVFESLFLAVSSFSNCGLTIGLSPAATDAITHLLLLPLAMIGGLGVTVLLELLDAARGRSSLSAHARTTIFGLATVYVLGLATLLALQWPGGALTVGGWRDLLATTSSMAINTRSLGLPMEYATTYSRPVVWIVMLLMTIGAGSGGTAGGLKVTTIAELLRSVRRVLSGQAVSRGFGIAIVWVGIYALIVLITQLLLLHQLADMPGDRIFFLAVSAVSNTGMSHDPLSITRDGLYTLSAAMFAGRIAPLLVLWWMADSTSDEELAIG